MITSKIATRIWLQKNVGRDKQFLSLHILLSELQRMEKLFGSSCSFADGTIDSGIELTKALIAAERGDYKFHPDPEKTEI